VHQVGSLDSLFEPKSEAGMVVLINTVNQIEDVIAILSQVDNQLNVVEVDGSIRACIVCIVDERVAFGAIDGSRRERYCVKILPVYQFPALVDVEGLLSSCFSQRRGSLFGHRAWVAALSIGNRTETAYGTILITLHSVSFGMDTICLPNKTDLDVSPFATSRVSAR
jgi:hypothetical protein